MPHPTCWPLTPSANWGRTPTTRTTTAGPTTCGWKTPPCGPRRPPTLYLTRPPCLPWDTKTITPRVPWATWTARPPTPGARPPSAIERVWQKRCRDSSTRHRLPTTTTTTSATTLLTVTSVLPPLLKASLRRCTCQSGTELWATSSPIRSGITVIRPTTVFQCRPVIRRAWRSIRWRICCIRKKVISWQGWGGINSNRYHYNSVKIWKANLTWSFIVQSNSDITNKLYPGFMITGLNNVVSMDLGLEKKYLLYWKFVWTSSLKPSFAVSLRVSFDDMIFLSH